MSSSYDGLEFEAVDFDSLDEDVKKILDDGRDSFVDMDRVHRFTNCSFDFAEHYGMSLLELYKGVQSMYVAVSVMLGEKAAELAGSDTDL